MQCPPRAPSSQHYITRSHRNQWTLQTKSVVVMTPTSTPMDWKLLRLHSDEDTVNGIYECSMCLLFVLPVSWLSVLMRRQALYLCAQCGLVFVHSQTSRRRGRERQWQLECHVAFGRPRSANGRFEIMGIDEIGCESIEHDII